MEKAKRQFAQKELAMLRRIMNDQQLMTYLVQNDLRKEQEFRQLAIEYEVNRAQLQSTEVHMAQQMLELDDDAMYNFNNRMDKQKYNTRMNTELAVEQQMITESSNDCAPVTLEPPSTPVNNIDAQMIFQDTFLQSIKEKDMTELPRNLVYAKKHFPEVMEGLICWAELLLRQNIEVHNMELEEELGGLTNSNSQAKPIVDHVELMFNRNMKGTLSPNQFPLD